MMMMMCRAMEQQLNNKNGGFGDIFLLLFSHAKFFLQKSKSTKKHTNKQTEKRERERFGTEHTSTTYNL
jgi:hypothetical protein